MKRLFPLFLLVACSTGSTDDKLIEESLSAHESAMKSAKVVRAEIEKITNEVNDCRDVIKRILLDSITVIQEDLENWESTITEIPDHEHNHEHGHEHNHDHSTPPNLTPQMILDIQNDLKERAERLKQRAVELGRVANDCN